MSITINKTHFQDIFIDALIDPLFGLDVDYTVMVWNDAMVELSGLDSADVLGKTIFEIFSIAKEGLVTKFLTNKSVSQFIEINGSEFRTIINQIDKDNQCVGYRGGLYSVNQGILKTLPREYLVDVIKDSPISTVVFNPDGSIMYSNNSYIKMWKLGAEDLNFLNYKYNIFLDKQLEEQGLMPYVKSAFSGESHKSPVFKYSFNTSAVGRTGTDHVNWLLANIFPILSTSGEVAYVVLNFTDVGEKYKLEVAVKESQKRLELALEGGGLGTWDWDMITGKIVYNDRWAEMIGYNLNEVYELTWESLLHPDDRESSIEKLNGLVNGEIEFYECEFRLKTKDGNWHWILDRGKVVEHGKNGEPLRLAGTHIDINERKLSTEKAKENSAKYRRLVDNAPIGIAIVVDEKLVYVNNSLVQMGGVENKEDVIGAPVRSFIPDDERYKTFVERYNLVVNKGENAPLYTTQFKNIQGKIFDVEVVSIPVDFGGTPAMQVLINNISDRNVALDELAKNKELLYQLFQNSPMGIVMLDENFNISSINKGFEKIFGFNIGELKGHSLNDFIVSPELFEESQRLNDSALKGEIDYFESYRYNKAGEKIPVLIHALPVVDRGIHIGIYGIYIDIGQRLKAEEELQTRNLELDNFVYKVSHDLRAPLASILGLINLTKLEGEKTDKEYYIDLMEGQVLKLDHFIRDILSHSKNLKMSVSSDQIDFQEIVQQCFDDLGYLDGAASVVRNINIENGEFLNDKWRISEIFRNLISNAIKYRNQDATESIIGIDIKVDHEGCDIIVADNGIGIPEDKLPYVMEMFYRGTESSDGSGIGLYIVQKAVDKVKGRLSIESVPNEGTSINIWLPSIGILEEPNL